MLPAKTLAAISNVVALNLEPSITAAVLGAVLAPLLKSSEFPNPRNPDSGEAHRAAAESEET
jgi:hypothetical protein